MPKSLVEKIAECCKGVEVAKLGDNGEYAYLRILDIANALREKLFAAGVLIIPSDVECELTDGEQLPETSRRYTCAKVKTDFSLTDGNEEIHFSAYGYARDMDAKCVAIAQTAALKSFLKRLALIFGDYDDPEVRDETIADLRPDLQRKIDEQTCITKAEIRAIYSAMKKGERSLEDLRYVLKSRFGIEDPAQLQKQFMTQVMEWALNASAQNAWANRNPNDPPSQTNS